MAGRCNSPSPLRALISLLLFLDRTLAVRIPRHASIVSRQETTGNAYDFIIAGGGVAGLTVADRLTEDPDGELSD